MNAKNPMYIGGLPLNLWSLCGRTLTFERCMSIEHGSIFRDSFLWSQLLRDKNWNVNGFSSHFCGIWVKIMVKSTTWSNHLEKCSQSVLCTLKLVWKLSVSMLSPPIID